MGKIKLKRAKTPKPKKTKAPRAAAKSTLAAKVSLLCILIVVVSIVASLLATILSTAGIITSMTESSAASAMNTMQYQIDSRQESLLKAAAEIAGDSSVIYAQTSANANLAQKQAETLGEALEMQSVIILGGDGALAAQYPVAETKADISALYSTTQALAGESCVEFTEDPVLGYAIRAAVPIANDYGYVMGVVSVGFPLSDSSIVTQLKEMTGCEYSFSQGDVILSTTMGGGSGNAAVISDGGLHAALFERQEEFRGRLKLFNVSYRTVARPIISAATGETTGYFMACYDLSSTFRSVALGIIIVIIAVVIVIAVGTVVNRIFVRKNISQPLAKVVGAAGAIESGNIDPAIMQALGTISSNDEVGELASSMTAAVGAIEGVQRQIVELSAAMESHDLSVRADVDSFSGIYAQIISVVCGLFDEMCAILESIRTVSCEIDSSAVSISAASNTLANGAVSQASSIEELVQSIEGVAERSVENSSQADKVVGISNVTVSNMESSKAQMEHLMKAMHDINDSSSKISGIIKTIEDIAFQTNILALNASVEAARAGSAGKGFSVVADEVRNLAQKSSEAASQTTEYIEMSIASVQKGTELAQDTESAMNKLVEQTIGFTKIVHDIAERTNEEKTVIEQVNEGCRMISDVVQTNSATAEETAASSVDLGKQAGRLSEIVGKYKF